MVALMVVHLADSLVWKTVVNLVVRLVALKDLRLVDLLVDLLVESLVYLMVA